MPMNAKWHAAHPMPPKAGPTDRLLWHLDHAKACACRPIPPGLRVLANPSDKPRCHWAGTDPLMIHYHDTEWGLPVHDDRHFFEMLVLEGAQAGLSWMTILKKRDGYRRAFAGFDPKKVARFDAKTAKRLLDDPSIVRNRLKVEGTITSAKAFLALQKEFGSFDAFVWPFVGGKPIVNRPRTLKDIQARTAESDALSRALVDRGFKFVGSTICYAFMQACGLVDDHSPTCFRARTKR